MEKLMAECIQRMKIKIGRIKIKCKQNKDKIKTKEDLNVAKSIIIDQRNIYIIEKLIKLIYQVKDFKDVLKVENTLRNTFIYISRSLKLVDKCDVEFLRIIEIIGEEFLESEIDKEILELAGDIDENIVKQYLDCLLKIENEEDKELNSFKERLDRVLANLL